jgi:hypothetical protein
VYKVLQVDDFQGDFWVEQGSKGTYTQCIGQIEVSISAYKASEKSDLQNLGYPLSVGPLG